MAERQSLKTLSHSEHKKESGASFEERLNTRFRLV